MVLRSEDRIARSGRACRFITSEHYHETPAPRGAGRRVFTWPQRLNSAVVGALTARYATPAAVPVLPHSANLCDYRLGELDGSVGFALGLVGMTICDAAIRWARRWRDDPPPSLHPPPRSDG